MGICVTIPTQGGRMLRRFVSSFSVLAALMLVLPAIARSQGTGSVAGQVTDRASHQPLADVTVSVPGTASAARTGSDGRYRLRGVRTGTVQVRATRLGYAADTRTANVVADQEATVNFDIAQTAVTIDQVVITATGESQRKRESGNTVSRVDVTDEQLSTVTTLSQLLTAKAPGLYINSPGGTTGSASR